MARRTIKTGLQVLKISIKIVYGPRVDCEVQGVKHREGHLSTHRPINIEKAI